ncbi:MAG TPA: hypothetical protein VJ695_06760, partial [Nitrososphaera sp.]|nr:hypothetical protein [Nitrososphaera sp.]
RPFEMSWSFVNDSSLMVLMIGASSKLTGYLRGGKQSLIACLRLRAVTMLMFATTPSSKEGSLFKYVLPGSLVAL